MKILINGFGRIGKSLARQIIDDNLATHIHINDPAYNLSSLEYSIKYDTIYGKINYTINKKKNFFLINKIKVTFTNNFIFNEY